MVLNTKPGEPFVEKHIEEYSQYIIDRTPNNP